MGSDLFQEDLRESKGILDPLRQSSAKVIFCSLCHSKQLIIEQAEENKIIGGKSALVIEHESQL